MTLQDVVKAGGRVVPLDNSDEARRKRGDIPSDEGATESGATFVELTREEALQLAQITNPLRRLKEFRKLRKDAACNVCKRRIGHHSDKQMAKCYDKMAEAFEKERIAKAKRNKEAKEKYDRLTNNAYS